MKKKDPFALLFLRYTIGALMLYAGVPKLLAATGSVAMFTLLGMEPAGRIIIGLIEVACGFLLFFRKPAATAAVILAGVMFTAIVEHIRMLGVNLFIFLAIYAFVGCIILAYKKREDIIVFGKTL